jgi:pimeloyl-ACP methyl ester carboxylesterase
MRETFKHIVQEDLVSSMKAVVVPCALVWGSEDRITPVWIAHRMKEEIAHSHLIIIPDADHGVSFKQPQRFLHAIKSFLKTI